jgi:D-xylose transport system ATP-binding protein
MSDLHAQPATPSPPEPLLEARNITKRFGALLALDDVSLTLHRREVLALLGDNGAGKSTLIKIISGVHQPDDGELLLGSHALTMRTPSDARAAGIETVYQDLGLFDNLSVAANFYAGRESVRPRWLGSLGFLRERSMSRHITELLELLEVRVPRASASVGLMSGGQRQGIAVARAAAFASRVVILDEPTAALGVREARNVLEFVRRFAERDIAVILISHNLEHVTQVADRAVILRQGRKVGEVVPSPENHALIVSRIVGGTEGPASGLATPARIYTESN